jgi:hypothetical protein
MTRTLAIALALFLGTAAAAPAFAADPPQAGQKDGKHHKHHRHHRHHHKGQNGQKQGNGAKRNKKNGN